MHARLEAISDALAKMVRRQSELDARVARMETYFGVARRPEVTSIPPPALPSTPPPLPEPNIETRLGLNWLNRVAVITLLFGVAFFFKYAVDSGWIGPAMRVALGIVAATLALAVGEWMSIKGHRIFAQGVTGLGVSLLYLSFYASFAFYHLLPQGTAFALMSLTTLSSGFLALHSDSQAVAILGLIGGFLTPPLLSTGQDHPWVLLFYSLSLSLAAMALAKLKQWQPIVFLSFVGTALLYLGSTDTVGPEAAEAPRAVAMLWISLGFCLFLFASKLTGQWLLLVNAIACFSASYSQLHRPFNDWMGALALVFSLVHFGWAQLESRLRDTSLAVAVGFVTLAIPLHFHGYRITMAWAIEAAVLAWLSLQKSTSGEKATDRQLLPAEFTRSACFCVLSLTLARLILSDAGMLGAASSYATLVNLRFLTFVIVAASFWFIAHCFSTATKIQWESGAPYALGHAVLLWALLLEANGWSLRDYSVNDARHVFSLAASILMALYGLALIASGTIWARWLDRILGLALLGLVIAKLYLIDVWDLNRGARILAFLVLGAVLLLVSYLYSRYRTALDKLFAKQEESST